MNNKISFPDPRVPSAENEPQGPVLVIDPMNNDNNITHDWSLEDLNTFLSRIDELCDVVQDALNEAEVGEFDEAAALLEQIFPNFRNWTS